MKKTKRNYQNDYPSVTQIIGQLRSPALEYWFKSNSLEEINRLSARGKEIGKQLHQCIQDFIETGESKIDTEYPEEITTSLKSFQLFRKENPQYILKKSEIALTSELHGYNGTLDCLCHVGEDLWIADWKTQNIKEAEKPKAYSEYFTQVAAYTKLYNECMKDNIQNVIIVCLAKDKVSYSIDVIGKERIEEEFNEVFLPLLKVWKYKQRSK